MGRLRLRGMRFFVHVGSTEAERATGHHLEVDLELGLDVEAAGEADDLAATADYSALHAAVGDVLEEGEYEIVEAVAVDAADAVEEALEADVDELVVVARKPNPPVPGGPMDHAEAEVRRQLGGS